MPYLRRKWIGGIVLGTSLLLGLGGSGLLLGNTARPLDCPDPGIFVGPDTTTTAQMRVIEPPPDVDPGMTRPTDTECRVAASDAHPETESEHGATRSPPPSQ